MAAAAAAPHARIAAARVTTAPSRDPMRFFAALFAVVTLSLWFALAPSVRGGADEARAHVAADDRFKVGGAFSSEHVFRLGVHLPRGSVYILNETTTHIATTHAMKAKGQPILSSLRFKSSLSLRLRVASSEEKGVHAVCQLLDLSYTEESTTPTHSVNKLFAAVRKAVVGVDFTIRLAPDGTVLEMDTARLRRSILDAVHDSGQLPMSLEHALQVGDNVFPAMGASFNANGHKRVSGPVVRIFGPNCVPGKIDVAGRIAVVDRGGCDFISKAKAVSEGGGVALVVVNNAQTQKKPGVYMDGDGVMSILSVLVSKEAADAIEAQIRRRPEEMREARGVLFGSANLTILGGASAVQALHNGRDGAGHVDVTHADGLHDLIGLGSIVDEAVRSRFSIFPRAPVGIGASWQRSILMSEPGNPRVRALLDEKFRLAQTSRMSASINGIGKSGDLLLDLDLEAYEKPVHGGVSATRPTSDEDSFDRSNENLRPALSRPSFRGHAYSSTGSLRVHASSGVIITGEIRVKGQSERSVVVQERISGAIKTIPALVIVDALTSIDSEFVGRYP